MGREFGVEAVDALDDEHGVIPDLQRVATEDALARSKVERGQVDLFAAEQALEVMVEVGQVDGIKRLEVVAPGVVAGGVFAVDVVII